METSENIISQLREYVESKQDKTSKRVYNWLNHDNLNAVILDRGVFWYELMGSTVSMPDYIYNYIKKWGTAQGYQYLYDLK